MYRYNDKRLSHIKNFTSDNIAERWIYSLNLCIHIHKYDINKEFCNHITNKEMEKAFDLFVLITNFDNNDNGTYSRPTLRETYDMYNKYGRKYIFDFVKLYANDVILT